MADNWVAMHSCLVFHHQSLKFSTEHKTLCAPILKRATGRPRKSRIRPRSEGAGLGARRHKCTRCGGTCHFAKYCDNAIDPAFGDSFDENVGQQPVATDEANVAHQPHGFDDDPNDDFPDDPNDAPNDATNDAPNEAPNDGNQPSLVVSSASSAVGLKKTVDVPKTKRRREEAPISTRITRSKVVAMSTRIRRRKVAGMSTRTNK
ncbi:uncharacterized protein LOC106865711 [Brachypodium distachyon]|uniref:uncharacterized protein LOC106865711 n=1 Tax=Brachypodium distachyon TaxID=15368 RepID=UPI000D0CA1CA|nr:uncharacterized protein LOC106865711 [Brachypodium distachyon]|eukprot:XP_024314867.1 uncharacterized protein LOC106865711 [Brachypodium distachyon]